MIIILTGPIQTGKTTALRRAFGDPGGLSARGVLQPVIGGRRHALCLESGETRLLESQADSDTVHVGRFAFSAATLAWARACIDGAPSSEAWLVIDEVGPLELRGDGLAESVRVATGRARRPGGPRLLLVVREGLVGSVVRAFGLHEATAVRLSDRLPGGPRLAPPWAGE